MKTIFLDFEQPLAELEAKIEELRFVQDDSALDISEEIARLQKKSQALTREIYGKLTAWQIAQVARHPQRPYTLDYVNGLFTGFEELHGDRAFADDPAIVGGLARFNGETCMVIGHQKGRDTKEKIHRNFGMPKPEGYRKALRLMRLAEKFGVPVFTFIDTPGAYPGVGAEERGQSEAIGRNLYEMAGLRVPIVCTVIGEGGSGGALAIAVGDVLLMLQYATYSVISPEGCASILWKSADHAAEAAETLGITATRLKTLGLIDRIVNEPPGGAHRDHETMLQNLRKALQDAWRQLRDKPVDELLEERFDRLIAYGRFKEAETAEPAATGLVALAARHLDGVVKAGDRVVVGLSGGVDSVVLLDILAGLARRLRFVLSAFHVNHQLSPNAARWAAFCRRLCRGRGIGLRSVKVVVPRGDSVEAAARRARYRAFGRLQADFVALGHNQDDQAETLLLQLLRGAGVKGLAAMPVLRGEERRERRQERSAPAILRPMLDIPRGEIERYARRRKLEWMEDESNADTRYVRNFLRREVLPLIATRFPACRASLARSAQHLAEAAQLLEELARLDAGDQQEGDMLAVAALRAVSHARAKNVLRWFIGRHGAAMPNTERLDEALRQLLTAAQDARVCIDLGTHQLRRYSGRAYLVPMAAAPPADYVRSWSGEPALALPELGGVLRMKRDRGRGISLARLQRGSVTVRVRQGGETLRPDPRGPSRSLKHLLQEAGVPPWQRGRLPLLYCGAQLMWVPGLGTAAGFQAAPGEAAVRPEWRTSSRARASGA